MQLPNYYIEKLIFKKIACIIFGEYLPFYALNGIINV